MRIIRDGNLRLEVVDTDVLMGLIFILFGGVLAYGCATKLSGPGQASLGVYGVVQAAGFVLFGGLLSLAGIFLCRRVRFTFDQGRQELIWRRTSIFGSKTGTVPLADIRWAYVENEPAGFTTPVKGSGSHTRLVLALREGTLPFSNAYSSNAEETWARGRDAINDFLGRSPGEGPMGTPDDDIRKLVKAGQSIEAIRLVRERLDCSLAEAKQIVDDLDSS